MGEKRKNPLLYFWFFTGNSEGLTVWPQNKDQIQINIYPGRDDKRCDQTLSAESLTGAQEINSSQAQTPESTLRSVIMAAGAAAQSWCWRVESKNKQRVTLAA